MAITQEGAIGTGATTIYTSSGSSAITCMFLMNDNAAARVVEVHVVKNGASATVSNKIIKNLTIDPADTYVTNMEKLILENGDTIQVSASAGSSVYGTVSSVSI